MPCTCVTLTQRLNHILLELMAIRDWLNPADMNYFDGMEGFGIQELLERVGSENEMEFMEVHAAHAFQCICASGVVQSCRLRLCKLAVALNE